MNEIKYISSSQNALIKKVVLLQEKSRERKKTGLFTLEGIRELELASKSGYQFHTLLFNPDILSEAKMHLFLASVHQNPELIAVSKEVYQKIAYRATTEGVIAIVHWKTHDISSLVLDKENPLVLVAQAPEKPGNIGALLRTADAANMDAVLIADPKSDLYNPNIIRSSVGCLFTNTIAVGSTAAIISFLEQQGIHIFSAALSASEPYTRVDFTKGTAIVVGTEATGLTSEWLEKSTKNIIIPMQGEIDSLNVSVSAAILIFEAKRQRGFK